MKEQVVIFGASTRGDYVYEKLKDKYQVKYFCDNDIKKHGNMMKNIKIISPEKLSHIEKYKIIVASMYHEEICEQLYNLGIKNFEIYPSNMECTIKQIEEKGINLTSMNALEVFGGNGKAVDTYILNKVKSLEVWEIDKRKEIDLRNNLPGAKVKITDSFNEIKITENKYDIIILDNPMEMFNEHCENFDMFIHIFNVLKDEAIIILDIIPSLDNKSIKFEYLKNNIHLLCRKLFYRVENPLNIPIDQIIFAYEDIINKNGYKLEWSFIEERSKDFIYYLVLKIKKNN